MCVRFAPGRPCFRSVGRGFGLDVWQIGEGRGGTALGEFVEPVRAELGPARHDRPVGEGPVRCAEDDAEPPLFSGGVTEQDGGGFVMPVGSVIGWSR